MDVERAGAVFAAGAVPLDLRDPLDYAREHIPGAVNLPFGAEDLGDRAEIYLGRDRRYVLVAAGPEADMAQKILGELGFVIEGALEGGMSAWRNRAFRTVELPSVPAAAVASGRFDGAIVDVREPFEFAYGHIPGAISLPASKPWTELEAVSGARLLLVCAGRHRATFVASILKRAGREDVTVLEGGITAWQTAGYPLTSRGLASAI